MYLHNSELIFSCDRNLFWKMWLLKMFFICSAKFACHLCLHFISFLCCARIVNWWGNMPEFYPFVWVFFWLQCVELLCHRIKAKERKKSWRMFPEEGLVTTLRTDLALNPPAALHLKHFISSVKIQCLCSQRRLRLILVKSAWGNVGNLPGSQRTGGRTAFVGSTLEQGHGGPNVKWWTGLSTNTCIKKT